jgi:hypothetical protein
MLGGLFLLTWYCLLSIRLGYFGTEKAINYSVLKDNHETLLIIGVDWQTSSDQLVCTLVKAAQEHQYDGRDYYLNQHLVIIAYLVNREQISLMPAGVLARFVLPLSKEGKEITDKPLKDLIFTSLTEAKFLLNKSAR